MRHTPELYKIHRIVKSRCPGLVGDSHRYANSVGKISLLYPCEGTLGEYEIYCIRGDLLDDIERFDSLESAEHRIKQLLKCEDMLGEEEK